VPSDRSLLLGSQIPDLGSKADIAGPLGYPDKQTFASSAIRAHISLAHEMIFSSRNKSFGDDESGGTLSQKAQEFRGWYQGPTLA
jgi:hypothetical protein